MAYDYLRANGKKIGMDRDVGEYDVNLQVMSLSAGKDATDLGMAFYIALLSTALGRAIGAQLVLLGQMSLHGVLSRVDGLGDKLRVAMDAGARRVLIPTENSRDLGALPAEVLDKLKICSEQVMPKGTVKWFNPAKGYGFIQPTGGGGKDVFVHITAVERAGFSTLNEGQVVEYEEVSNRGRTAAENLRVSR